MKQFIDKLIERFEEEHERCINRYGVVGGNLPATEVKQCMEIVNQLAEEYSKDQNWQTTRNYLDEKYFSKIRELSAKYNHPCENVPINFDWVFGLIDKMEMQLAEEYKNDFCEWKKISVGGITTVKEPHRMKLLNCDHEQQYCPYCGKKIKVVE